MKTSQPTGKTAARRAALLLVVTAAAVSLAASSRDMDGAGARRPAATEFGLGPRTSTHGRYVATLEPGGRLRPRQMQKVRVTILDSEGRAIDDAAVAIDGGMPQHGHGLPTRPRVTRNLGGGAYEIEGVRFNMGGWWEFRLAITATAGADTVTFNLDL
jgi:hypothetical protein